MGESSDEDWTDGTDEDDSSMPLDDVDIYEAFAAALGSCQVRTLKQLPSCHHRLSEIGLWPSE